MFNKINKMAHFSCALLVALTLSFAAQAATKVRFGVPEWPGEQVKAEVAKQLLETAGYQVENMNVGWLIAVKSVAMGQLDADMAIWRPTQDSVIQPMLDKGEIVQLSTNVEDAEYNLVVPSYVYEAGVRSIADLHKFADKFEHKIYGIEAGNDGNDLVMEAIKANRYELKGFKLVESSTTGMLAHAGNAIKNKEWVVFLGWKPHWMNVIYDLAYLDDPELMWGGGSTVNTIVRPDYPEQQPNVTRFLQQMVIPAEVQSDWIKRYGYDEQPAPKVATEWLQNNHELLEKWLDGVTTADGKQPALELVKAKYSAN